MMEVRRVAMSRFGEQSIKRDAPMATIEEVLVPLYLHHRYQVEAASATVGGVYYNYALRGDGREPVRFAPAADQRAGASQAIVGDDHSGGARASASAPEQDPAASGWLRPQP